MAVRRRGKGWFVDATITLPGGGKPHRIRKNAPGTTKREALAFEVQLVEATLSTLTQSETGSSSARDERRYSDFAVEFLTMYAAGKNKHSELVSKESILRVHLVPYFGTYLLSEIDEWNVAKFQAEKLATVLSAKTVTNILTVLRKSLVKAMSWRYIDSVPGIDWPYIDKPGFDHLSFDESSALLRAADDEWRPMLLTALRAGLRSGELRALRRRDVDIVKSVIHVEKSVARGKTSAPKSNRRRTVPMSTALVEELKSARHFKGELFFCKPDGSMFTKNELKAPLRRAYKKAGLRKVGWHVLRHTCASQLVALGVPLVEVKEILGHAKFSTTLRYVHLAPDVTKADVNKLDNPEEHLSANATQETMNQLDAQSSGHNKAQTRLKRA